MNYEQQLVKLYECLIISVVWITDRFVFQISFSRETLIFIAIDMLYGKRNWWQKLYTSKRPSNPY